MELFGQLWEYNHWANETLLARLGELSDRLPATTLRLMSHIVNAQSVWLQRLNGEPLVVGVWDEHDLETCRRMNAETMQGIREVMERFGEDLSVMVSYTTTTGTPFVTSMRDILLQVFNHGPYHRAQIAMDLRQRGLEPVNTDYIIFVRSKIS